MQLLHYTCTGIINIAILFQEQMFQYEHNFQDILIQAVRKATSF